MSVVTGTWLVDLPLLIGSLLFLLYKYLTSNDNYFKERGIPYMPSAPLKGMFKAFEKSQFEYTLDFYNSFPGEKFFGYFQLRVPTLLVKDPDLVQRIVVKDFAHFYDRGFPSAEADPLSKNLFSMKGSMWRAFRMKLIPAFTTGKLKQMFEQLDRCADNLMEDVEKIAASEEDVELRSFYYNFPIEVAATTAFGLDFRKNSPMAVEFSTKLSKVLSLSFRSMFVYFGLLFFPKLINILKLSPYAKDKINYFVGVMKANKEYRKQNNIKRDDFFQLLVTLQDMEESGSNVVPTSAADNTDEDAIINQMEYVPKSSQDVSNSKLFTDEAILGQTFGFLIGGTESATGTLSFALYHIAKDLEIQRKVVEEVDSALKKHGSWTYQTVKDLTYLDKVLQETTRLYPILPITFRKCTIPYKIPDTKTVIEKETVVAIPVAGLHMDPKYYPSPEVFNPDRFADNNNFKPSPTFMPFGDGPRICIGMRFAIMEMKVCLGKILAQYSVELSSKAKGPLTLDPKSFSPKAKDGLWVNFKSRFQKSI